MKDERLMEMVKNGALDKMTILFERYHMNLYNFYLKKRHPYPVAEDLTQNVFERILKYRHSYDSSQAFRAWFFRIARNVELDYFRAKKIKVEEGVELNSLSLMSDTIQEKIEKKETLNRLNKAISLLSKEEQELLHFSKFQKMKHAEIANITQLSESAVKVKIHRAIKKLKVHYFKMKGL